MFTLEEKLIEFVKNNEFLYNKKCRNYKNKSLRNSKYEELSAVLSVPAQKLKDRWRTLRDAFYKELKNESLHSSNVTGFKKKKWKWIDNLMFLKEGDIANQNLFKNSPNEAISQISEDTSISSMYLDGYSDPLADAKCETASTFTEIDYVVEHVGTAHTPRIAPTQETSAATNLTRREQRSQDLRTTVADIFFQSLAKQTNEANLSSEDLVCLQIELLQTFKRVVYKKN